MQSFLRQAGFPPPCHTKLLPVQGGAACKPHRFTANNSGLSAGFDPLAGGGCKQPPPLPEFTHQETNHQPKDKSASSKTFLQ